jgi:hypothetical protein
MPKIQQIQQMQLKKNPINGCTHRTLSATRIISYKQNIIQTVTVTNQNPEVTTILSLILDLMEAQNKKEYFASCASNL